jgi:uncharacterized membrane protein
VLAKQIYGFTTALLAALLMTVLPFAVWYSQEARAYALLMLRQVLAIWLRATGIGAADFEGIQLRKVL